MDTNDNHKDTDPKDTEQQGTEQQEATDSQEVTEQQETTEPEQAESDKPNVEDLLHDSEAIEGMYQNWFLDYASYVILERAVPSIEDGLKPVQRRILHAMKEMDDGRYNKVANVIGQTMQYHPHGDASISDAIVNMGQKDLLIDTQGNWGDVRTGDNAAASRYIEARLSKFGLDVLFNADLTEWQLSYDGRKREPVTLPVKFPLLLAQGVEGIAVGLATKILPHNFCELIEASIEILRGHTPTLYPDFITGGMIDVSNYNDGMRGGKVRVRCHIEEKDKKTLLIKDVPFGVTTAQLCDSIVKANDSGKIKIKKVTDNTAKDVEIEVQLQPGTSPDITIDALYAFTDCEVSISPNTCVIFNEKPVFLGTGELLRISTENTRELLRQELVIRKSELQEKILFSSLEKIFIENRIYRKIEECETFEAVIATVDKGLKPHKKNFYRAITEEDILRLLEIRIKRISKYDGFKADELMRRLEEELAEVEDHLNNLTRYAISYFKELLKKYGKGKERKTEIKSFEAIKATVVAAANQKLYLNAKDGFIGYGLKKDENAVEVSECSDIDEIIVFRRDGKCLVTKIQDKAFVGKDILHAAVFKKGDERMVYNLAYTNSQSGITYVKRFQVIAVTRDREYDLTKGGGKIVYLTANPNAEAEIVSVKLTANSSARLKVFDYNFADLEIKGRDIQGNILTKYPVKEVKLKIAGTSTLGGLDIWYDSTIGRLNTDGRGKHLGSFEGEDRILAIYNDGTYELTNYELVNRYDNLSFIGKFDPERIITAVHSDGKDFYVKRFKIETSTIDKKFSFITDNKGAKLMVVTLDRQPQVEVIVKKEKNKEETVTYDLDVIGELKGWRAIGNKLTAQKVVSIKLLASKSSYDVEKKNVGLEITNPDKIEPKSDDADKNEDGPGNGQLGMF
ncbi:DNA gyrase/topoisomerase IV subunit A [Xanthocytophaga flava]|uniref:DNA gyrase/topoisomerase IV subunit A n=1 Tax=Xanthocytophaga flava TaxID=3048013 RepID=UPI0028D85C22|nr:DNA gyrase/topoisomerase IV subunit A [Xanthocytophaga flavus]MDJ1470937.1 DNA gyrase/topoisomerase IV subunit A [Xanthocytophaga flavus]